MGLLGSMDLDDSIVGQLDRVIMAAESLGRLLEEELLEILSGANPADRPRRTKPKGPSRHDGRDDV